MTPILGYASEKTLKGEAFGRLTAICYLLSAKGLASLPESELAEAAQAAGVPLAAARRYAARTVCPWAKTCRAGCLVTSGGGRHRSTRVARARKTLAYHHDREGFWATVCADMAKLVRMSGRRGLRPTLRLDGTSDVLVREAAERGLIAEWVSVGVDVYAYTKAPLARMARAIGQGAHVTFSLQYGVETSYTRANEYLAAGHGVAVVFAGRALPTAWQGIPVVDGREHDVRSLDRQTVPVGPYLVGLSALGAARRNGDGFSVPVGAT